MGDQPGWLATNRNRSFPFLQGTVDRKIGGPPALGDLPDGLIVDAGFVIGAAVSYASGEDQIYLYSLQRTGSTIIFSFASSAPDLTGSLLVFTRTLSADLYVTEFVDSDATTFGSFSAESCDEPLWSGYMISGTMDAVTALLPGDGTITRDSGEAIVEPALVQTLAGSNVAAIGIANGDRTRVSASAECDSISWPFEPDMIFVRQRCMQGDLLFMPGFNCTLRQDETTNSLVFGAAVGAGEGQPCDEVDVYDGEEPPPGSTLLEGGYRCNEVLRSFNGVGQRLLTITGGNGVTVEPQPESNRILISVNMSGLALCADDGSVISISESF